VIDTGLMDRRRERPRCPVSRFGRAGPARQTHGDPTYLIGRQKRTFAPKVAMYKYTVQTII